MSRLSVRISRLGVALATATTLALVGGLASPTTAAAAGKDPKLTKAVNAVMADSRVQRASSGAIVIDAGTGGELYARYAWRATTPASNTKLFTAAAAMDKLGPNYTFRTEAIIRATPKNGVVHGYLYLKGYGDPTTLESDYRSLAKQVAARGIKSITGRLVTDATFFDSTRYNPKWSTSYASDYYAAQISALTVAPDTDYDSGTVILNYSPGTRGKKAKITVTPAAAAKYLTIVNKTTTSAKGTGSTFSASRKAGTNTITVTGRVALGRSKAKEWITVNNPQLYAGAVFRAELAKVGVKVGGATISGTTPATKRNRVALDKSMTLSKLLVPFLKLSNNMHAEALTKTMGVVKGKPGTWSAGTKAIAAYVKKVGAPTEGLRLYDGSGLTRSNKIAPRTMGVVLYKVQKEKWFKAYFAALPVAGDPRRMVGGTLKSRMVKTVAAKNAHAKTGTLTGVTALSGYVTGADGRRYVFSMLSHYSGSTPRPVEDKFVVALAKHRR